MNHYLLHIFSHDIYLVPAPFASAQEELESMLFALDKSLHGSETGSLTKSEVCQALESYFAVGQPGGKSLDHFDELMQVSDLGSRYWQPKSYM
jgi:hypothetical protein